MRLLLDTHVLLWFQADDPQLTEPARSAVLEPTNERWLSPGKRGDWGAKCKDPVLEW